MGRPGKRQVVPAGPSAMRTGAPAATRPCATGATDAGCHFSLTQRLTSGMRSINTSTEKYIGIMVICPNAPPRHEGAPIIHPLTRRAPASATISDCFKQTLKWPRSFLLPMSARRAVRLRSRPSSAMRRWPRRFPDRSPTGGRRYTTSASRSRIAATSAAPIACRRSLRPRVPVPAARRAADLRGNHPPRTRVRRPGRTKMRLTRGEPLLRREIERLVAMLLRVAGGLDLTLTTNGALLARKASDWRPPAHPRYREPRFARRRHFPRDERRRLSLSRKCWEGN